jgi:hypothetical protein
MAQYKCVIPLNGTPRYFKGEIYEFPPGKYMKDKDGNLDKHFELVGKPDPVIEEEKPQEDAPETVTEEALPDEITQIRVKLDKLGVRYHPATGLEKLKNKLAVAQS